MTFTFHYAALSDVGRVRKNNQDSGFAGANLLVLADGMGGPAGGDIASSIAIDHLRKLNESLPQDPRQALTEAVNAIEDAHQDLISMSTYKKELRGLGTTCITLRRCADGSLALTHIGDSRAYLLRNGSLTQCTKDHTLVQQLVDNGQITADEMKTHPMRSVLIRVLGDSQDPEGVELDLSASSKIEIGDRWLLCSDGLCGFVEGETITQVLSSHEKPEDACAELIELALKAGGPDNITCVVADIVEAEEAPQISENSYEAANLTNQETARCANAEVRYQAGPDQELGSITVGAAATTRLRTLRAEREEQIALNDQTVPVSPQYLEQNEDPMPSSHPSPEGELAAQTTPASAPVAPGWEQPALAEMPRLEEIPPSSESPSQSPAADGQPAEYLAAGPNGMHYVQGNEQPPVKKRKSRWLTWVGAILLIVIALAGTFAALYFGLRAHNHQHKSLPAGEETSLVVIDNSYTAGWNIAGVSA